MANIKRDRPHIRNLSTLARVMELVRALVCGMSGKPLVPAGTDLIALARDIETQSMEAVPKGTENHSQ
jgi:hypothetical protein